MARQEKLYECSCERSCKGITRLISRSKWYRHKALSKLYDIPARLANRGHQTMRDSLSDHDDMQQPAEGRGEDIAEVGEGDASHSADSHAPNHSYRADSPAELTVHTPEWQEHHGDHIEPTQSQPVAPGVPEHDESNGGQTTDTPSDTPSVTGASPSNEIAQALPPGASLTGGQLAEGEPTQSIPRSIQNVARFDDALPESITGSCIQELDESIKFRRALEAASLENGDLSEDQLHRLRHPTPLVETLDPDTTLSLKMLLSTRNASEQVYRDVRLDVLEESPDRELLSYEAARRKVEELTGITPIVHHMCPKSCLAYTGPFKDLEACPKCQETRFDPKTKKPRQYFQTMPLGPQIQERWKNPESAKLMQHRQRETEKIFEHLQKPESNGQLDEYSDVYHGRDYLEAVARGDIGPNDTTLLFSMDGAQLYQDKKSDCWIYIWVILDMAPDQRYKKKHIIPGGVIPGPNKPQHMESFLFPGFHHLAALQKEGLPIYNGATRSLSTTNLFLLLGSADGPGGVYFTGFVGHSGYYFCRLYCGIPGRHKPEGSHFYGALLKPDNYYEEGCIHPDIEAATIGGPDAERYQKNLLILLRSTNKTNYAERRKLTGLSSTSIFSGLPSNRRLPLPHGFVGDSMHVPTLNLGDLFLPLWRGMFSCDSEDDVRTWTWAVLKGDVWTKHGKAVGACRQYLPGSYDRPPRDLAKKIKSGYKAKEWQHYFYGLSIALLYHILPTEYWQNFCKLVYAVRLLHQRVISTPQVLEAHRYMSEFHEEYERLYVQRKVSRLHFMPPCLHYLLHMAPETVRVGPVPLSSTWPMERMVGDLTGQIRQPSNPYHNLSQRGLEQCQLNTLLIAYPTLARNKATTPKLVDQLGEGYAFLSARERTPRIHSDAGGETIRSYFVEEEAQLGNVPSSNWRGPQIRRWARLQLPNGQITRCAWKECSKAAENVRRARCVKLRVNGEIRFAEVKFYFYGNIGDEKRPLALVSLYSHVDSALFEESCWTLASVTDLGDSGLRVIDAKCILSVVAAIPWSVRPDMVGDDDRLFIYEQLGTEISVWSDGLGQSEDDADFVEEDED